MSTVFNISDYQTEASYTLEELDERFVNDTSDAMDHLTVKTIHLYDSGSLTFADGTEMTTASTGEGINILDLDNIFTGTNEFTGLTHVNTLNFKDTLTPANPECQLYQTNKALIMHNANKGASMLFQTLTNDTTPVTRQMTYDSTGTLTLPTGLIVSGTNVKTSIDSINSRITDITYTSSSDSTIIAGNVVVVGGKTLTVDGLNVKSNIDNLNIQLTGLGYRNDTDTTEIYNNLLLTNGKTLTCDQLACNNLILGGAAQFAVKGVCKLTCSSNGTWSMPYNYNNLFVNIVGTSSEVGKRGEGRIHLLLGVASGLTHSNFYVSGQGSYNGQNGTDDGGNTMFVCCPFKGTTYSNGNLIGYSFDLMITRTSNPNGLTDVLNTGFIDIMVLG